MALFIDEAVVRGAEDYRAGVARERCPFTDGLKRTLWQRGWDMQCKLWRGSNR